MVRARQGTDDASVFRHAPVGLAVLSPTGTIVAVTGTGKIVGRGRDELIGKSAFMIFAELTPPSADPRHLLARRSAINTTIHTAPSPISG